MSRSKIKGPFIQKGLIKETKKIIFLLKKDLLILPEYVNRFFNVYNGKTFIKLKIQEGMVGYRFGEFINTRKKHIYKKKK